MKVGSGKKNSSKVKAILLLSCQFCLVETQLLGSLCVKKA